MSVYFAVPETVFSNSEHGVKTNIWNMFISISTENPVRLHPLVKHIWKQQENGQFSSQILLYFIH